MIIHIHIILRNYTAQQSKVYTIQKNRLQAKTSDVTRCHTRRKQNSLISKKQ